MAQYPNLIVTNIGLNMIAESQSGKKLIFTKIKLGDGLLSDDESIVTLGALKNPRLDVPIQGFLNQGSGQIRLRFAVDNSGVEKDKGFFVKEIGVCAKLGEDGEEALYGYTNGGNRVDWLPDKNTPIDAQIFDIYVLIGNAPTVEVKIDKSIVYATVLDMEEHNANEFAHEPTFTAHNNDPDANPAAINKHNTDELSHKKVIDELRLLIDKSGLNLLQRNTAYEVGDIAFYAGLPSWACLECVTKGTTASTDIALPVSVMPGQLITDGTGTWMVEDTRDGNRVGDIVLRHILRPGYVKANGAVLQAADYPRLVQFVEEYNLSVTEAQWTASLTGMYVLNKTAGTLRVPDLRGRFLRALSEGGGLDNGRVLGSYQADMFRSHAHQIGYRSFLGYGNTGQEVGVSHEYYTPTAAAGGAETRPANTAYIAQIKY